MQALEQELQSQRDKVRWTFRSCHLNDWFVLQNAQRETLLLQCKEAIRTHQEKQGDLVAEYEQLQAQVKEKDALIESMAVVSHPTEEHQLRIEIEALKKSLSTENEQHSRAYGTLKTECENLTNELHQIKQALLDRTAHDTAVCAQLNEQPALQADLDRLRDEVSQLNNALDTSKATIADQHEQVRIRSTE